MQWRPWVQHHHHPDPPPSPLAPWSSRPPSCKIQNQAYSSASPDEPMWVVCFTFWLISEFCRGNSDGSNEFQTVQMDFRILPVNFRMLQDDIRMLQDDFRILQHNFRLWKGKGTSASFLLHGKLVVFPAHSSEKQDVYLEDDSGYCLQYTISVSFFFMWSNTM